MIVKRIETLFEGSLTAWFAGCGLAVCFGVFTPSPETFVVACGLGFFLGLDRLSRERPAASVQIVLTRPEAQAMFSRLAEPPRETETAP